MTTPDFIAYPHRHLRRHRIFGGIQPEMHKTNSLRSRIMPMPLPPNLILPLTQYHGANSLPLVKVGEQVLKYQVLTTPLDVASTPLHAPTSGMVTAIDTAPVVGPPGTVATCIQLQCDGNDHSLELQPCRNPAQLTASEVLRKIDTGGIVGMGGAGFPTALKLRLAAERGTGLLIINAAECEPYISTDEALLRERASAVVTGADLLQTACHATRCVIAIEEDKLDAIAALRDALAHSAIELLLLKNSYPAGSEKQLVQAVTGLEVPAGRFPIDLGVLVHNAGTAWAVWQAVVEGKPSISRIITLTGGALQTPKNFEALVGTPVSFLFELCGINNNLHRMTVIGGSLMGIELTRTDVPVTKISNCLIAATAGEFPAPEPERACIRCGYCAEVCPSRLLPQQLFNFARTHNQEQLRVYGLQDCIECGACAYVCPSKIPLVQYYLAAKQELADSRAQRVRSEQWQARFQQHQYRNKNEKEQNRESRHKSAATATGHVSTADSAQLITADTESGTISDTVSESTTDTASNTAVFSRSQAREEIAEAVARVRAKKLAQQSLAVEIRDPVQPGSAADNVSEVNELESNDLENNKSEDHESEGKA